MCYPDVFSFLLKLFMSRLHFQVQLDDHLLKLLLRLNMRPDLRLVLLEYLFEVLFLVLLFFFHLGEVDLLALVRGVG